MDSTSTPTPLPLKKYLCTYEHIYDLTLMIPAVSAEDAREHMIAIVQDSYQIRERKTGAVAFRMSHDQASQRIKSVILASEAEVH